MKLKVELPNNIRRAFIRAAKKVFPNEHYGILLGSVNDAGVVKIKNIFFPSNIKSDEYKVNTPPIWYDLAKIFGQADNSVIVGDIHSHCWDGEEVVYACHAPSENDWDSAATINKHISKDFNVFAICLIVKKNGKLRASIKFWPVIRDVKTKIT